MTDSDKRAFAETVFEREQRREKEISSALKLEAQRHEQPSRICVGCGRCALSAIKRPKVRKRASIRVAKPTAQPFYRPTLIYGSGLCRRSINVRFTPKSGHWNSVMECPLCAKSGHQRPGRIGAWSREL